MADALYRPHSSANADPGAPGEDLYLGQPYHYGACVYHNVNFGYHIEPINTLEQSARPFLLSRSPNRDQSSSMCAVSTNSHDVSGSYFVIAATAFSVSAPKSC